MPAPPGDAAASGRSDRRIVLAGLVVVSAAAWAYLIRLPTGMTIGLLFAMWAVMMVAMMVPTATPTLLSFAAINRRRRAGDRPYVPTACFLLGYVTAWMGFSVLATAAQWVLHDAALLSPMGVGTSPILGGGLLVAAGLFQWTRLKDACLSHCRSPAVFLMTHWREGRQGAFVMGLRHGLYCVGCCWLLMALLFVAGVMNLLWIAALMAFVLFEKLLPRGDSFARMGGGVLVAGGLLMLVRGLGA